VSLQFGEFRRRWEFIHARSGWVFFVGRAIRAPALARHRRVRRASPTRLPDSVRFHVLWKVLREALDGAEGGALWSGLSIAFGFLFRDLGVYRGGVDFR
jgi:hypothetical protein